MDDRAKTDKKLKNKRVLKRRIIITMSAALLTNGINFPFPLQRGQAPLELKLNYSGPTPLSSDNNLHIS